MHVDQINLDVLKFRIDLAKKYKTILSVPKECMNYTEKDPLGDYHAMNKDNEPTHAKIDEQGNQVFYAKHSKYFK